MKYRLSTLIIYLLIIYTLFGYTTHAQTPYNTQTIDVSSSIENPAPGDKIILTAKSYSVNISSANVVWSINNKVVNKGIGLDSYSMTLPTDGKNIIVSVSATPPSGGTYTGSIEIKPSSVDLVIESDGFIHSQFQGKLSPVFQNKIKIIAVPHITDKNGKEYDPQNLVYRWKVGESILADQSGYGKQSAIIVQDILPNDIRLSVEVFTRDGSIKTGARTLIEPSEASVSLYIDDPVYGTLFNRSIGNILRIGGEKEASVKVIPFGFNKSQKNNEPSMTWYINDYEHPELANKDSITLRTPEEAGIARIRLNIQNNISILQRALAGFEARFTKGIANTNNSEFE
jgi:hypothetical protein